MVSKSEFEVLKTHVHYIRTDTKAIRREMGKIAPIIQKMQTMTAVNKFAIGGIFTWLIALTGFIIKTQLGG